MAFPFALTDLKSSLTQTNEPYGSSVLVNYSHSNRSLCRPFQQTDLSELAINQHKPLPLTPLGASSLYWLI